MVVASAAPSEIRAGQVSPWMHQPILSLLGPSTVARIGMCASQNMMRQRMVELEAGLRWAVRSQPAELAAQTGPIIRSLSLWGAVETRDPWLPGWIAPVPRPMFLPADSTAPTGLK